METIENKNDNGDLHGYQEWYYDDSDTLILRGNEFRGLAIGYHEIHAQFSGNKTTEYHII